MAKVMISMPDELLERLDERARELDVSRSGIIREAVESELDRPTPEQIRRALREGQELLADVEPFDSAELIREMRDEKTRNDVDRR